MLDPGDFTLISHPNHEADRRFEACHDKGIVTREGGLEGGVGDTVTKAGSKRLDRREKKKRKRKRKENRNPMRIKNELRPKSNQN